MSKYKCKHCDAGAISKCVLSRTVFPDNQFGALVSQVLKRKVVWQGEYTATVELQVYVALRNDDPSNKQSKRAAIVHALEMLKELDEETIQDYACDHEWIIDEGECMFGCCVANKT